jgi:hypothetical protein
MNVVILQPSYVPWRGYFHQIQRADLFVFYDDVQYDKRGWRNRNRVKTPDGSRWITIPVHKAGIPTQDLAINDVRIDWDKSWNRSHWDILRQNYREAPFLQHYTPLLEGFYGRHDALLADFTIDVTIELARELGIRTEFVRSSTLGATGAKTDRLVEILKKVGATHYLSGPSAKDYLEERKLTDERISLEYMTRTTWRRGSSRTSGFHSST